MNMTRYELNTTQKRNNALAEELKPKDNNISQITNRISNLELIQKTNNPAQLSDRYETGISGDDIAFQNRVLGLLLTEKITENTLIISDTGHDIPIFATLARNLDIQPAFMLPSNLFGGLDDGNERRVLSQAQTWGDEINAQTSKNASDNTTKSIFIGLDAHRQNRDINPSKFPTSQELKKLGIENIVYLAEAPPQEYKVSDLISKRHRPNLRGYFDSLEKSNLNIKAFGVDPRQNNKPNPQMIMPPPFN